MQGIIIQVATGMLKLYGIQKTDNGQQLLSAVANCESIHIVLGETEILPKQPEKGSVNRTFNNQYHKVLVGPGIQQLLLKHRIDKPVVLRAPVIMT